MTQQREAKNEHIERTASNTKLFTPTFVQTNVEGGQYEEIFRDGLGLLQHARWRSL